MEQRWMTVDGMMVCDGNSRSINRIKPVTTIFAEVVMVDASV